MDLVSEMLSRGVQLLLSWVDLKTKRYISPERDLRRDKILQTKNQGSFMGEVYLEDHAGRTKGAHMVQIEYYLGSPSWRKFGTAW